MWISFDDTGHVPKRKEKKTSRRDHWNEHIPGRIRRLRCGAAGLLWAADDRLGAVDLRPPTDLGLFILVRAIVLSLWIKTFSLTRWNYPTRSFVVSVRSLCGRCRGELSSRVCVARFFFLLHHGRYIDETDVGSYEFGFSNLKRWRDVTALEALPPQNYLRFHMVLWSVKNWWWCT